MPDGNEDFLENLKAKEQSVVFNESVGKRGKIRYFLSSKPYWVLGGIIGVCVFVLFFIFFALSGFLFPPHINATIANFLKSISFGFDFVRISCSTGGPINICFGEGMTGLGSFYFAFIFFLAGSFIGSLFDIFKRKNIVSAVFWVLLGFIFGYFIFAANFAGLPFRCSLLSDKGEGRSKSSCLLDYASSSNILDVGFCLKFPEDHFDSSMDENYFYRSDCYSIFARRAKKIEYCEYIPDGYFNPSKLYGKENCYLCASTDPDKNDICFSNSAFALEDPSICEKVIKEDKKVSCYMDLAMYKSDDGSVCEKITSSWERGRCYTNVASHNNKFELCEKILDPIQKGRCVNNDFGGIIDDENINFQYSKGPLSLERLEKALKLEDSFGYYKIDLDSNISGGDSDFVISIDKNVFGFKDLNDIENSKIKAKQFVESPIVSVQIIKLGKYDYVKTIRSDHSFSRLDSSIEYESLIGNRDVLIINNFGDLPVTEEKVKKIEDLVAGIHYKFDDK